MRLAIASMVLSAAALSWLVSACSAAKSGRLTGAGVDPEIRAIGALPLPDFWTEKTDGGNSIVLSGDGQAFARITYNPASYRFEGIRLSGGWSAGDAVSLAIVVEPGVLDFGVAPFSLSTAGAAELRFSAEPERADRIVSIAPDSALSSVPDFAMVSDGAGGATCTWSYRNQGDHNQDGEVGVADITPIALNFLEPVSGPDDPLAPIDSDESGEVGVSDITPIALNYLRVLTDFELQFGADGENYAQIVLIPRADGVLPDGGGYLEYEYALAAVSDGYYRVVPFDGTDGTYGIPSNAVHWEGGGSVTFTIALATAGVAGSGTEADPYIFDQEQPYDFTAMRGEEDITDQVTWEANPPFVATWSAATPGRIDSLIPIAGDFTVRAEFDGELSNILYCRKPLVTP
ncbi:MAG: hypothetical protein HRF49_02985 [bacterium]|jgi:hypothetical protein